MRDKNNEMKPVSLSDVKNKLNKISKDREELLYEQKIALEHAQKFVKLNVTDTKKLIKDLSKLDFIKEMHVHKIADILPTTVDDVKTLFAKERINLSDKEIKEIINIVAKYYTK